MTFLHDQFLHSLVDRTESPIVADLIFYIGFFHDFNYPFRTLKTGGHRLFGEDVFPTPYGMHHRLHMMRARCGYINSANVAVFHQISIV